eukprot:SAG31_NODE_413_length_15971_cov_7.706842_8_plen_32_part_00
MYTYLQVPVLFLAVLGGIGLWLQPTLWPCLC